MEGLTVQQHGSLDAVIARIGPAYRAVRAELMQASAAVLKRAVYDSMAASGLKARSGRVRSWQTRYDGSGGGYTAVRPLPGGGDDGPGAITSYLERGHRVRFPSGRAERYQPRVQVARARAYWFYRDTEPAAKQLEAEAVQTLERRMAAALEGQT